MVKKGSASSAKPKRSVRHAKKALGPREVHAKVSSLLSNRALRGRAAEAFAAEAFTALPAATAAVKAVTFSCNNIGCLVRITSGGINFVFSGTGGHNFPVGASQIIYAVQGPPNQLFAITAQGGTLDSPINSRLTQQGRAGGPRVLTVTA